MTFKYTQDELSEYFWHALTLFNGCLDSDISKDNVILEFFVPENGVEVYERFCGEYFPNMLEEAYNTSGYFETFGAQAFVGDLKYGVLIRLDIDFPLDEIVQMYLHEISHLFCTKNEIKGGHFFDKYCLGTGEENGKINAGYAIWREAVADIMADSIISENAVMTLRMVKNEVWKYYHMISYGRPESKKAMSLVIAYIMISKEVATQTEWAAAEKAIDRVIGFKADTMKSILKMVFENLHRSPFWEISLDYIRSLGDAYIFLLAQKALGEIE